MASFSKESLWNHQGEDPMALPQSWIAEAKATGLFDAGAMTLSTLDPEGHPVSRVVSLLDFTATGVVFGTSDSSNKAQQIAKSPWVAGNLFWREPIRQINFQGAVTQLSDIESDKLFAKRPRAGQAASVLGKQSTDLGDEAAFPAAVANLWAQVK